MPLVSISGAPIAGKTTLWRGLRARLGNGADFVSDIPRLALETLGPARAQADLVAFQHYVGFAQLIAEQSDAMTVRVFDKSLLDALAYWDVLVRGASRPAWAPSDAESRYALAIICEREPGMRADGAVQELHEHLGDSLAARIREHAAEHAARVVTVIGDPKTRLETALAAIAEIEPATRHGIESVAPRKQTGRRAATSSAPEGRRVR